MPGPWGQRDLRLVPVVVDDVLAGGHVDDVAQDSEVDGLLELAKVLLAPVQMASQLQDVGVSDDLDRTLAIAFFEQTRTGLAEIELGLEAGRHAGVRHVDARTEGFVVLDVAVVTLGSDPGAEDEESRRGQLPCPSPA